MKPHRGKTVGGRYRLDRPLARGGMGTVWAATHVELDTPVAIKFLDDMHSADVESQTRFRREARATARVRSPNIVQIHDFGVEDHRRFIVMELLQGEDLAARLRRTPRLQIETVRTIVTQVAKALERVHAAGIVHRDIKPGNIFVSTDEDGTETIKVVDFGLVHLQSAEQGVTMSGVLIGTPQFMAPEQARDCAKVDHRTDLWALGAVAYRALTGEPVVKGNNVVEVLMHIARHSIRPPSNVASDLGEDMDRFFEKALAMSPDDRFQSARELATAFLAIGRDPDAPLPSRSPFSSTVPGPPTRTSTVGAPPASVVATAAPSEKLKAPSVRQAQAPSVQAPVSAIASAPTSPAPAPVEASPAEVPVAEPMLFRTDETQSSMALPRLDGTSGITDAPWRVASSQADARASRKRTTFAIGALFAAIAVGAVSFRTAPDRQAERIPQVITVSTPGVAHAASQPPAEARRRAPDDDDDDAPAKKVGKPRPSTTTARPPERAAKPAESSAAPSVPTTATAAPKPTAASEVF